MNKVKLHVGNVSFHLSEAAIKSDLSANAEADAISCSRPFRIENNKKVSAPYAFLYVWDKDVPKFVALHGYEYEGKKISVTVAKNQDKVIQRISKELPPIVEGIPLEEVTEEEHATLAQDEAEEQLFQMSQETNQE
jgi:hypothetical protein